MATHSRPKNGKKCLRNIEIFYCFFVANYFFYYKLLIFLLKFRLQNIGKNIEKEVSNFNPWDWNSKGLISIYWSYSISDAQGIYIKYILLLLYQIYYTYYLIYTRSPCIFAGKASALDFIAIIWGTLAPPLPWHSYKIKAWIPEYRYTSYRI